MHYNFLCSKLMACGASRYADTNLEAEKKEYIDHIEIIVQWMGRKPFKITYTNDYFQELYELAVELIKKGHAYVDHQFTPHPHAGDKWCIYPSYDCALLTLGTL
ncbi:Glutamine--tRNA ligase [Glycine soja]